MHVLFFMSCLNCKMALLQYFKRTDKLKVALPSKCRLQQVNDHIQKTVGDETTTSGIGKKQCNQYNDYSA